MSINEVLKLLMSPASKWWAPSEDADELRIFHVDDVRLQILQESWDSLGDPEAREFLEVERMTGKYGSGYEVLERGYTHIISYDGNPIGFFTTECLSFEDADFEIPMLMDGAVCPVALHHCLMRDAVEAEHVEQFMKETGRLVWDTQQIAGPIFLDCPKRTAVPYNESMFEAAQG